MDHSNTNDELRERYEEARAEYETCPTTEELVQYLHKELPEEQALHVSLHVTDCADCVELVEMYEASLEPVSSDPGFQNQSRSELERVASNLGFGESAAPRSAEEDPSGDKAKSSSPRWYDSLSWLWRINTPLAVPLTACLLLVAVIAYQPFSPHRGAGDVAQTSVASYPFHHITIDQSTNRSAGIEISEFTVVAGRVYLIQVFLSDYKIRPGHQITIITRDESGRELSSDIASVNPDRDVRHNILFLEPGVYTVSMYTEGAEIAVQEIEVTVVAEGAGQ